MKVFGQLESAQLEMFTTGTRPSASSYNGRVIWLTDAKQVQVSDGTTWLTVGAGTNSNYEAIVGSAADVVAGVATHSSLISALAAVSNGDSILVLNTYATAENITVSKQVLVLGLGYGSRINGTVTFDSSSDNARLSNVRVSGNITLQAGADRVVCDNIKFDGDFSFLIDDTVTGEFVQGDKP